MLRARAVRWLEEHRALVVVAFCLPASFLFGLLLRLRGLLRGLRGLRRTSHRRAVAEVQRRVREWRALPAPARRPLCTARPNWQSLSTTFFDKRALHRVPLPLYDILRLDERALTLRVEPMVTVGAVTRYLVPRGLALAVTIELEDATLGGLALGTGMSTHSHKAGLYHETVVSYEVVLSDGSLVEATADNERADLFAALPWSHGSLGFLVALTLRLVRIKPYVKVRYAPFEGQKRYCDALRRLAGAERADPPYHPDFVEATVFSRDRAVLVTGDYSDFEEGVEVNRCARWYKPWFYKHVESALAGGERVELIPVRDYLLRHNRPIFWVVEDLIPFGNEPWFRALLGWLLPPKPAFLKLTTTPGVRAYTFTRQVFQDVVLPMRELERQIDVASELFDKFPLLVYPCRVYDRGPAAGLLPRPRAEHLVPGTDYAMYNDLGVYGAPGRVRRREPYDAVAAMRALEQFARDVGGFSFLYADIFMTRAEFGQMFELERYEAARRRYGAEGAFPHLFDKVRPEIDVLAVGAVAP